MDFLPHFLYDLSYLLLFQAKLVKEGTEKKISAITELMYYVLFER